MRDMNCGESFPHVPNEWFPFSPAVVREWAQNAEWREMLEDLDLYGKAPRFVGQLIQKAKDLDMLSPETLNMLETAAQVFQDSMKDRKSRALDDLRPLQLWCWDAGWHQLKPLLSDEQCEAVRGVHRRLRAHLLPGIWTYRFLPHKLPPLRDENDDTFRWWECVVTSDNNFDAREAAVFPVSFRSMDAEEDMQTAIDNSL